MQTFILPAETSRHKLPVPIQSRIVPAKPTPKPLISQKKVPEGLASLRAPVQETGNSAQSITGYMVDTHQVLQANPLADSVYEELEDSTAGTGDSGFEDVELWKRYMQHPPSRPLIPGIFSALSSLAYSKLSCTLNM